MATNSASDESLTDWFAAQLRATSDIFVWTALQIPKERRWEQPFRPADWGSAARHLFHMAEFDHEIAEPTMRLWLGGPPVDDARFRSDNAIWLAEGRGQSYKKLIDSFLEARERQIALLPMLATQWDERRSTVWDVDGLPPPTLSWVVTKNLQHTVEQANALLRKCLYFGAHVTPLRSATPEPDLQS